MNDYTFGDQDVSLSDFDENYTSWQQQEWTERQAFRAAVLDAATKAKVTLPESSGRIESAIKLVLSGDVTLHDDGSADVASRSHPARIYPSVNGSCPCTDYEHAPGHWCAHRLARALQLRADRAVRSALAPMLDDASAETSEPHEGTTGLLDASAAVSAAPLPEAPASVNCYIQLAGRQVQLTLRDTDEDRLLQRLAQVLERYPVETPTLVQAAVTPERQCPLHAVPMEQQHNARGAWYSHRMADGGWCKGK